VLGRRLHYRDLPVDPVDLVKIGGVWVTRPVRTLADLSRVADDAHVHAAMLLADAVPGLVTEASSWLRTHGALPNKRSALAFLADLAAMEADRPIRTT
ncbi:MAG TPA: hypothetical protein VNP97_00715, partial [Microbacterium sp.]|nr:hypothetical protein [Microbacterium sp.]